jgi:hypothetical protein
MYNGMKEWTIPKHTVNTMTYLYMPIYRFSYQIPSPIRISPIHNKYSSTRLYDSLLVTLGFDSRQRLEIFLFTTTSRMALGPTQPPIQWVSGSLSMGVKWPVCEANHSPSSSAEVKE